MLVFDGAQKIGLFLWEKIQKLDFKNRKIALVVEEDADQAVCWLLSDFPFQFLSHFLVQQLTEQSGERTTERLWREKEIDTEITLPSLIFPGLYLCSSWFWPSLFPHFVLLEFSTNFSLILQSGQVQLHTFVFNLSSHKACKHLWKCAIEHHTFFRLKYHKPRIAKASQLFRLGSTFRYR